MPCALAFFPPDCGDALRPRQVLPMSPPPASPGTLQAHEKLAAYGVRERLLKRWQQHAGRPGQSAAAFASPQQQAMLALCASHKDVLCTARPAPLGCGALAGSRSPVQALTDWAFPARPAGSAGACSPAQLLADQGCRAMRLPTSSCWRLCLQRTRTDPRAACCRADAPDHLLDAVLLHCLSHVADSAARIKHNNDAIKAAPDVEPPRDQGFVRAKVAPVHGTTTTVLSWRRHAPGSSTAAGLGLSLLD